MQLITIWCHSFTMCFEVGLMNKKSPEFRPPIQWSKRQGSTNIFLKFSVKMGIDRIRSGTVIDFLFHCNQLVTLMSPGPHISFSTLHTFLVISPLYDVQMKRVSMLFCLGKWTLKDQHCKSCFVYRKARSILEKFGV